MLLDTPGQFGSPAILLLGVFSQLPSSFLISVESPSSPCIYTPPDTLGTSTGDSISTHPDTIHADTPRPSVNDNISTSVNSVDDTAHPNDAIKQQLSISELAASLSSHSLSPQQKTVVTNSGGICHALYFRRRIQGQTPGLGHLTLELRSRQIFMGYGIKLPKQLQ